MNLTTPAGRVCLLQCLTLELLHATAPRMHASPTNAIITPLKKRFWNGTYYDMYEMYNLKKTSTRNFAVLVTELVHNIYLLQTIPVHIILRNVTWATFFLLCKHVEIIIWYSADTPSELALPPLKIIHRSPKRSIQKKKHTLRQTEGRTYTQEQRKHLKGANSAKRHD